MATYLQSLKDYQAQVDKIQNDYKAQVQAYQAKADVFKEQSTDYQKSLTDWKVKRNGAVAEAEGLIKTVNDNFGWTFVDKRDTAAYWKKLIHTWESQGIIILVLMTLAVLLVWRKDRA